MSLPVKLTQAAVADLDDTWLYIAMDDRLAADRFLDLLQGKCSKLGEFPEMGRVRPELGEAIRSFPFRRYVILYTVTSDAIFVLRIVPGARDLPNLF